MQTEYNNILGKLLLKQCPTTEEKICEFNNILYALEQVAISLANEFDTPAMRAELVRIALLVYVY